MRKVLRQEYTGLAGIVLLYSALIFYLQLLTRGGIELEWPWVSIAAPSLIGYVVLRTLKRHTRWLKLKPATESGIGRESQAAG